MTTDEQLKGLLSPQVYELLQKNSFQLTNEEKLAIQTELSKIEEQFQEARDKSNGKMGSFQHPRILLDTFIDYSLQVSITVLNYKENSNAGSFINLRLSPDEIKDMIETLQYFQNASILFDAAKKMKEQLNPRRY